MRRPQVAPLVGFYYWWFVNQKETNFATVVHALGRGFFDVTFMMICASYGALIIGMVVLFWLYDVGAFKKGDDSSIVFTFYVFVLIPFVASEECFKAIFVRLQHKKIAGADGFRLDDVTRVHLIHSTATSAGYALSQSMGWVTITHLWLSLTNKAYAGDLGRQIGSMLLVGVLVTLFGTPLQLLSGYLIGLEVERATHRNSLPLSSFETFLSLYLPCPAFDSVPPRCRLRGCPLLSFVCVCFCLCSGNA